VSCRGGPRALLRPAARAARHLPLELPACGARRRCPAPPLQRPPPVAPRARAGPRSRGGGGRGRGAASGAGGLGGRPPPPRPLDCCCERGPRSCRAAPGRPLGGRRHLCWALGPKRCFGALASKLARAAQAPTATRQGWLPCTPARREPRPRRAHPLGHPPPLPPLSRPAAPTPGLGTRKRGVPLQSPRPLPRLPSSEATSERAGDYSMRSGGRRGRRARPPHSRRVGVPGAAAASTIAPSKRTSR
jgi:hypothetical protein